MFRLSVFRFFAITLFLALLANLIKGQEGLTKVKGIVSDAETGEALPFVNVTHLYSLQNATITNTEGIFSISVPDTVRFLRFSCIGYETIIVHISPLENQYISVKMHASLKQLSEVTVKGKRKRYKNKGRPAVELIEKVINHKYQNHPEYSNFLEYNKYQKIVFSFVNIKDNLKQNKLLKPFSFIFENVDTTILSGKPLIPVYIKESLSKYYARKSPPARKEIINAENIIRFDEYINRRSVSASLNYLYQDIDLYNNNINLLTNQFLSPIATMAPAFYKYYIRDTLLVEGTKCIKLTFEPRNKTDMLFDGDLYIAFDSSYAVKKASMRVNKDINLNWVRSVDILQEFEKTDSTGWMLVLDKMGADFGITQESIGVYGQRTTYYQGYKKNSPGLDSLYQGLPSVMEPGAEDRPASYWSENRPIRLSRSEQNIYTLTDSLKQVPQFRRNMNIISTLSGGFLKVKWFELGLYSTFYSYNPIEGSRLKIGGRTTDLFSKKFNFDTYIAWGTEDKKYKYGLGLAYSLSNKTIREFPVKTIRVNMQHDIKIPGEELQFAQSDDFLMSIKRGENNKMFYNETYTIEHLNEFSSHFSYCLSYEFSRRTPTGMLFLNSNSYSQQQNSIPYMEIAQVGINLRYAPNEKFFQGTIYRTPYSNKYPVMQLQYYWADKALGSDYNYQSLRFNISKRFYLSVLGYSDVSSEFGRIFGSVPYLLLNIHRANQTYNYQELSYNLMNFLEFASDKYASLNIDHCFNGFLFNKIPLMKKLMFREVASFKILYGGLDSNNNPSLNPDLFKFPTTTSNIPLTYTLESKPYIEVGIGVSNIFRIFRIDFVKRLSYLDHYGISTSGVRFSYKMDF
jgi:hypothetical protein